MREKRSFLRFVKLLKIRYLLSGGTGNWQKCAIIDVSRSGMKIRFHEGIDVDSTIFFVLTVPGEDVPINLKGTLRRIEGKVRDFIGGVELTERLDDETFIKIMNGYNASPEKIETGSSKEIIEDAHTPTQKTIAALFSKQPLNNYSCKHVFSFLGSSVSLFSLVLFLSLPVLFLMVTGYFSGKPSDGDLEKKEKVLQLKEVLSPTNSESIVSREHTIDLLDNPYEATLTKLTTSSTRALKEEGGNLYFLALKHYQRADETLFDLILQANPALTDIRQIHDDQKIILPVITAESYIKNITDGNYRVHVGTFETMDLVGIYSDKVIYLEKSIVIQPHRFSSKDIWYRVLLGNFTSKEKALKAVRALNKKGIIYIPPAVTAES